MHIHRSMRVTTTARRGGRRIPIPVRRQSLLGFVVVMGVVVRGMIMVDM